MKREKVIKSIKDFFDNLDWKYDYNKDTGIFTSGINMGNVIGSIKLVIMLREHHYKVAACLNSKVESEHIAEVAEYLHRANFGMNNGNFELDYRDGEIRYKTFTYFKGIELSNRIIEDSIALPILMFDKYGKNLMMLMLGEGVPKNLIEEAEKCKDE